MINVKLYKNFIKDISGLDYYTGNRVNSLVGFYVLGIDNSGKTDDTCRIFYRGKADFINIDGKSNQLMTNLYIGDAESILQQSSFRKFCYLYQVVHDKESLTVDKLDGQNSINFKNDYLYKDGTLNTIEKLKDRLGTDFRIAFDIYSSSYDKNQTKLKEYNDQKLDNKGFLAGLTAYEGFRPIIDIHSLKVMTNLVSVTISENPLFHIHDLDKKFLQINESTQNLPEYKNYSVNSLTEFVNQNRDFQISQTDICYEDWNLINLNLF